MSDSATNTPWFSYPSFEWKKNHAVIIGGGISGCQMAWHLCQEGWDITLIERHHKLASEASGNAAGVISPKMTSQASLGEDFYTHCYKYTLSQLNTLIQQRETIKWHNCGALQLAHNAREENRWDALKQRFLDKDNNKNNLSNKFIQLLDKHETSKQAGIELNYKSCYFPEAGWIDPANFCHVLSNHPNCKIIYQTEALTLEKDHESWLVKNNNHQEIAAAEAIIICSGKDLLTFEQSNFLPCMPVAGQTTTALASNESKKLQTVIGHEGYLTPAINNQHIFGATFEREQSNPALNSDADHKNTQQLRKYLPGFTASLSDIKSSHTAVRMTTPDRYPYVGALPDKNFYLQNYYDLHQGKKYKTYPQANYQTGLFILGGLGSRGLTTSGLCAKTLCSVLTNSITNATTNTVTNTSADNKTDHSQIEHQLLHSCHPARFLIKNLKRAVYTRDIKTP